LFGCLFLIKIQPNFKKEMQPRGEMLVATPFAHFF